MPERNWWPSAEQLLNCAQNAGSKQLRLSQLCEQDIRTTCSFNQATPTNTLQHKHYGRRRQQREHPQDATLLLLLAADATARLLRMQPPKHDIIIADHVALRSCYFAEAFLSPLGSSCDVLITRFAADDKCQIAIAQLPRWAANSATTAMDPHMVLSAAAGVTPRHAQSVVQAAGGLMLDDVLDLVKPLQLQGTLVARLPDGRLASSSEELHTMLHPPQTPILLHAPQTGLGLVACSDETDLCGQLIPNALSNPTLLSYFDTPLFPANLPEGMTPQQLCRSRVKARSQSAARAAARAQLQDEEEAVAAAAFTHAPAAMHASDIQTVVAQGLLLPDVGSQTAAAQGLALPDSMNDTAAAREIAFPGSSHQTVAAQGLALLANLYLQVMNNPLTANTALESLWAVDRKAVSVQEAVGCGQGSAALYVPWDMQQVAIPSQVDNSVVRRLFDFANTTAAPGTAAWLCDQGGALLKLETLDKHDEGVSVPACAAVHPAPAHAKSATVLPIHGSAPDHALLVRATAAVPPTTPGSLEPAAAPACSAPVASSSSEVSDASDVAGVLEPQAEPFSEGPAHVDPLSRAPALNYAGAVQLQVEPVDERSPRATCAMDDACNPVLALAAQQLPAAAVCTTAAGVDNSRTDLEPVLQLVPPTALRSLLHLLSSALDVAEGVTAGPEDGGSGPGNSPFAAPQYPSAVRGPCNSQDSSAAEEAAVVPSAADHALLQFCSPVQSHTTTQGCSVPGTADELALSVPQRAVSPQQLAPQQRITAPGVTTGTITRGITPTATDLASLVQAAVRPFVEDASESPAAALLSTEPIEDDIIPMQRRFADMAAAEAAHDGGRFAFHSHRKAKLLYREAANACSATGQHDASLAMEVKAAEQSELARESRQLTNEAAFAMRNSSNRGSLTIDLHNMHVDEALSKLRHYLKHLSALQHPADIALQVITGQGRHSPFKHSTVRDAVMEYLNRINAPYVVSSKNPGKLAITL